MKQILFLVLLCGLLGLSACRHAPTRAETQEVTAYLDLAKSYFNSGHYRDALAELLKAENAQPSNREVQYMLASTYFMGFNRHNEAKLALKKVFSLNREEYPEAENLMGVILLDEGDIKGAISYLEKASNNLLYATPYFALQNLGDAYARQHRYADAVAALQKALQQEPKLCGAYVLLSKTYRTIKQSSTAASTLENGVMHCDTQTMRQFVPQHLLAQMYLQLGQVRLLLGDKKGGKQALETCANRFSSETCANECRSTLRSAL